MTSPSQRSSAGATNSLTRDVSAVFWKESREQIAQLRASRRGTSVIVLLVLIFGLATPWSMGRQWLESGFMLTYWPFICLGLVSSVAPDAFAGERERHTLETLLAGPLSDLGIVLGKLAGALAYAMGILAVILPLGVMTVNLRMPEPGFHFFPEARLPLLLALSLLTAALGALVGLLVSLRAPTAREAQQSQGIIMTVIIILPALVLPLMGGPLGGRIIGTLTLNGATRIALWFIPPLFVLNAILLLVIARRFRRGQLLLD